MKTLLSIALLLFCSVCHGQIIYPPSERFDINEPYDGNMLEIDTVTEGEWLIAIKVRHTVRTIYFRETKQWRVCLWRPHLEEPWEDCSGWYGPATGDEITTTHRARREGPWWLSIGPWYGIVIVETDDPSVTWSREVEVYLDPVTGQVVIQEVVN